MLNSQLKIVMNKYKEMIQSLKARLEKERLSLIKLDRMMNGDSQNSNQIPFALDSKPIDPMKNQPRRDSIATSQRNDVDMMRNKNERPKMNPFESEIPQDKSSNLNLSMANDPNFKRNQINTMRQIGNAVHNKDQSGKIPKGGKGKGGEFPNELEENKGYQRNFPTPSGSLIQEDNQIRQTPTDSQRELKSLPFVMNTHPRVLEIQKKEAGRNTPIANQRFNDISIKLSKDKEGDIDGKKYNLRHKIEEGGNSEIKLK